MEDDPVHGAPNRPYGNIIPADFERSMNKQKRICGNSIKSLAEFAASAANKLKIIFCRGVYLTENTSQAASVEFVCRRQTNYARSRLQKLSEKAAGLFRQAQRKSTPLGWTFFQSVKKASQSLPRQRQIRSKSFSVGACT